MELTTVLMLIWMHFVADFILQSDEMAMNKSKDNGWLGLHVFIYSLPFALISPLYALINGVLHFMTDYVSSREASKLRKEEKYHWFFVVIGLDQAIHISTLLLTYKYLF